MGRREQQEDLLEAAGRLIRAQDRLGDDDDLREARLLVGRHLPETLSRRAAGRLLGVSHKALERWIERGDLPLVPDEDGRLRIPAAATLDLFHRIGASGSGHRLERTVTEDHARADRLHADSPLGEDGHGRAAARALVYHRAVADRLDDHLVREARHRLRLWVDAGRIDGRWASAWERLLDLPLDRMADELRKDDADAADLRQSSPFAGALSEAERRRILASAR